MFEEDKKTSHTDCFRCILAHKSMNVEVKKKLGEKLGVCSVDWLRRKKNKS
jgi:hypothetical protein